MMIGCVATIVYYNKLFYEHQTRGESSSLVGAAGYGCFN